jgi:hypothetical protein
MDYVRKCAGLEPSGDLGNDMVAIKANCAPLKCRHEQSSSIPIEPPAIGVTAETAWFQRSFYRSDGRCGQVSACILTSCVPLHGSDGSRSNFSGCDAGDKLHLGF